MEDNNITKTETVNKTEPQRTKNSEFSKIVWPSGKRVWSETATVMIVGAILATIIFFVDLGLRTGIEFLIK